MPAGSTVSAIMHAWPRVKITLFGLARVRSCLTKSVVFVLIIVYDPICIIIIIYLIIGCIDK